MSDYSKEELSRFVNASNIDENAKEALSALIADEMKTPDSSEFGSRLRVIRVQKGYPTCGDLAKAIGVNRATVGKWENGTRQPDLDMLVILCHFLNVSPNDLLCLRS